MFQKRCLIYCIKARQHRLIPSLIISLGIFELHFHISKEAGIIIRAMVTGKRSNQIFSVRVFLFNKNNTEIDVIFFSQKEFPVALSTLDVMEVPVHICRGGHMPPSPTHGGTC